MLLDCCRCFGAVEVTLLLILLCSVPVSQVLGDMLDPPEESIATRFGVVQHHLHDDSIATVGVKVEGVLDESAVIALVSAGVVPCKFHAAAAPLPVSHRCTRAVRSFAQPPVPCQLNKWLKQPASPTRTCKDKACTNDHADATKRSERAQEATPDPPTPADAGMGAMGMGGGVGMGMSMGGMMGLGFGARASGPARPLEVLRAKGFLHLRPATGRAPTATGGSDGAGSGAGGGAGAGGNGSEAEAEAGATPTARRMALQGVRDAYTLTAAAATASASVDTGGGAAPTNRLVLIGRGLDWRLVNDDLEACVVGATA